MRRVNDCLHLLEIECLGRAHVVEAADRPIHLDDVDTLLDVLLNVPFQTLEIDRIAGTFGEAGSRHEQSRTDHCFGVD